MLFSLSRVEILQLAIIFVISISVHEFAHARVSHKLGDPTPKLQKRLTLNPLAHIDPIGLLAMFLIRFGRGKPVQVNPSYYKNQTVGEFKVAIAGPLSNMFLASIGIIILLITAKQSGIGINTLFTSWNFFPLASFLVHFSLINIILAVFNMIPIPPLDGFTLIKLINLNIAKKILQYQQYIFIGFLALIFISPFGNIFGTVSIKIFHLMLQIFGTLIY